jgi:hypothetical protein
MKTYTLPMILTGVLVILSASTGCRPKAETERKAQLKEFTKRVEQINASITLGMPYSDVAAQLGQPFLSQTNDGWILNLYHFDTKAAFYDSITDGIRVDFSNNAVIRKLPITGNKR